MQQKMKIARRCLLNRRPARQNETGTDWSNGEKGSSDPIKRLHAKAQEKLEGESSSSARRRQR